LRPGRRAAITATGAAQRGQVNALAAGDQRLARQAACAMAAATRPAPASAPPEAWPVGRRFRRFRRITVSGRSGAPPADTGSLRGHRHAGRVARPQPTGRPALRPSARPAPCRRRPPPTMPIMPWPPSCPTRAARAACHPAASAAARQASRRRRPALQPLDPGPGDHRGIVGAKRRGGARNGRQAWPQSVSTGADQRICCHAPATARTGTVGAGQIGQAPGASFRQHIGHRRLKPAHKVAPVLHGQPALFGDHAHRAPATARSSAPRTTCRSRAGPAAGGEGKPPGSPCAASASPPGRRVAAGPEAWRSCRTPRRGRRRSCRPAGENHRPFDEQELAMPAGHQQHQIGKGHLPSVSRGVSAWPARWLTPTSGRPARRRQPLGAASRPTARPDQPRPRRHRDAVQIGSPARPWPAPLRRKDPAARHGRGRRFPAPRRQTPRAAPPALQRPRQNLRRLARHMAHHGSGGIIAA
jgi:hypothetical protein